MNKPVSPHLQIYKLPLTALMSISHRISGFFLFFGTVFLAWLFVLIKTENMICAVDCFRTCVFFKVCVALWLSCYYYHMFNGLRHLFWDSGFFFSLKSTMILNVFVIFLTLVSVVFVFYIITPFN